MHPAAALHGGTVWMAYVGDSPPRVLCFMLLCHALWVALYVLYARLLHPVNCLALALLALPPLAASCALCRRWLSLGGLEQPLAQLFAHLDFMAL